MFDISYDKLSLASNLGRMCHPSPCCPFRKFWCYELRFFLCLTIEFLPFRLLLHACRCWFMNLCLMAHWGITFLVYIMFLFSDLKLLTNFVVPLLYSDELVVTDAVYIFHFSKLNDADNLFYRNCVPKSLFMLSILRVCYNVYSYS